MNVVNSSPKKRKTRNYTFRLDEELLETLFEESREQGINPNALMNKVLQQYRVHGRYLKRFGALTLSRAIFSRIIDCCSEEKIQETAKSVGSTDTIDVLRAHGIPVTYDTVLDYLKSVGAYSGWFDSIQHVEGTRSYLHLRHELGEKWSTFLAETISTMFKSILNIEVKTEKFENSVTIELQS